MKPKPARSMQLATPSGSRSMRAPSASSTSAEPDELVAERLPCLATAQPGPAAINAAVVETFDGLPLRAQRDQEARDLDLGDLPAHDLREHLGGLLGAQVGARGERVDRPCEDLVRHQRESRKFASRCRPSSVSTDSGWNWTPSA